MYACYSLQLFLIMSLNYCFPPGLASAARKVELENKTAKSHLSLVLKYLEARIGKGL